MNASDGPIPEVHLDAVTKRFGSLTAVDGISLSVEKGEFFSLLGPSGCGKSTLLRLIGGFETPDLGSIYIREKKINDLPPQKRPTAMVFQNYALFPTMTVGENVGYGLKVRGTDRTQLAKKVATALERVDMGGMESKPVTQLSGGQQQRVALARAIVIEPSVLLFDEPLSNLDVALREQTRRELKRLQREIGITSIYVTHDQQEALALSDRLAVLRDGRVQQEGRPEVVYFEPANEFVARFMGGSNVFSDQNQIRLLTGSDDPDGKVLSVRPEHWIVQKAVNPDIAFHIRARQFLGVYNEFTVDWNGTEIRLWLPPDQSVTEPFTALPAQTHWLF